MVTVERTRKHQYNCTLRSDPIRSLLPTPGNIYQVNSQPQKNWNERKSYFVPSVYARRYEKPEYNPVSFRLKCVPFKLRIRKTWSAGKNTRKSRF